MEGKYGVPVAPISTIEYKKVVDMNPIGKVLQFVYTPHPVVGVAQDTLYDYISGDDPHSGKPVNIGIMDLLTKMVNPIKAGAKPNSSARQEDCNNLIGPDTEENLQALFYKKGWTEGLPIIVPTEERVRKMLEGTNVNPDELVAEVFLEDTNEVVKSTVANIATIAVMAGAETEYLPVILAIASMAEPSLRPSTTPFGSMVLVNGPIAEKIGINSGLAAFSAVNKANAVIGRAWTLISHCWGFSQYKKTLWSSLGNNFTYNNMCVAENEKRSCWQPFHVQNGYKKEDNAVSLFRGWTLINSSGAPSNRSVTEEMNILYEAIPSVYSNATIIMDPLVAKELKDKQGFKTKEEFSIHLSNSIKIEAGKFWAADTVQMLLGSEAERGVEPYSTWSRLNNEELINQYHDPKQIRIIVVGGETSPLFIATDYRHLGTASIDKWLPTQNETDCIEGLCGLPDKFNSYDD